MRATPYNENPERGKDNPDTGTPKSWATSKNRGGGRVNISQVQSVGRDNQRGGRDTRPYRNIE